MAIGYTAIFTKIGKLVKAWYTADGDKTTYTALADEIKSELVDQLDWPANDLLDSAYGEAEMESLQSQLKTVCDEFLSSLELELNSESNDPDAVIDALAQNMVLDAETILQSVFTTTQDSYVEGTDGKKIVFSSIYKDAATLEIDEESQQTLATLYEIRCSNGFSDGADDRDETYSVNPDNTELAPVDISTGDNVVEDGVFANGVDDWDTTGVVTPTATGGYYPANGTYAALATGAIIEQELDINNDTVYNFSMKMKGTGDVIVTVIDQDANFITLVQETAGVAWALYEFSFVIPEGMGPTFSLKIEEAMSAAIDISDVYLQTGEQINGQTVFAIPTVETDNTGKIYSASVAATSEGRFQTYFFQNYQRQLPSAVTPTETISDTLTT